MYPLYLTSFVQGLAINHAVKEYDSPHGALMAILVVQIFLILLLKLRIKKGKIINIFAPIFLSLVASNKWSPKGRARSSKS